MDSTMVIQPSIKKKEKKEKQSGDENKERYSSYFSF